MSDAPQPALLAPARQQLGRAAAVHAKALGGPVDGHDFARRAEHLGEPARGPGKEGLSRIIAISYHRKFAKDTNSMSLYS